MEQTLRDIGQWLLENPIALVAVVMLAFVVVITAPFTLLALVLRAVGRGTSAVHRRARWTGVFAIILPAAALVAGVHLWSTRTSAPLLIYGEGPVPKILHRIAYDLTVEPDGSLLVREEIAMTLTRDPRSLFRPLRRDQPATVLSLTDNDRPVAARLWIGPQYGIRMGTGTPSGEHVYRLTYRLAGAARADTKGPERVCLPFGGGCTYLSEQRQPVPVQRVRWCPVTWRPDKQLTPVEQTVTWHFPAVYAREQLATLNGRSTWAAGGGEWPDDHTLRFIAPSGYTGATWFGELAVPASMTEARQPAGSLTPSLPVVIVPLLALLGVIAMRLRLGGNPRGLATLKAEYAPPDGLSAAQIGRLVGAERTALVAAAIADAAHRRVLRVEHLVRRLALLPDGHDDAFVRTGSPDTLPGPEHGFIRALLGNDGAVRLSQAAGYVWGEAAQLEQGLHRSLVEGGFISRRRELQRTLGVLLAVALLIGGPAATFFLGNQFPLLLPVHGEDAATMQRFTEPALIAWVVAAVLVAVYALSIPTITRKGALARSRARGYAEYLRMAELGQIEHEAGAGRATRELPYALALGLSTGLTERWRGLCEAPGDDDERTRRRGNLGRPAFGDEGLERWLVLGAPTPAPARATEGGMPV